MNNMINNKSYGVDKAWPKLSYVDVHRMPRHFALNEGAHPLSESLCSSSHSILKMAAATFFFPPTQICLLILLIATSIIFKKNTISYMITG